MNRFSLVTILKWFKIVDIEEEEQSIVEEEERIIALDRAPYYERHDKAYEMMGTNRIKNLILQKKLSMYFKRKKVIKYNYKLKVGNNFWW